MLHEATGITNNVTCANSDVSSQTVHQHSTISLRWISTASIMVIVHSHMPRSWFAFFILLCNCLSHSAMTSLLAPAGGISHETLLDVSSDGSDDVISMTHPITKTLSG